MKLCAMYNIIVVGAGVAGLIAAGTAAAERPNDTKLKVLLLEKMEKPARKLRITGKGRCNITNTKPHDEFLSKIKQGAEFAKYAFEEFDNQAVIKFLNSIGLPTMIERGDRVFPASGRAQDVADALEKWAKSQGVEIMCNAEVSDVNVENWKVASVSLKNGQSFDCQSVIITTGGVSYPLTGSTGDGYQFAFDAGHAIVPLRPALVPLVSNEDLTELAGLQLRNVSVNLYVDNILTETRFGDVDFYEKSISGATILQISRTAVDAIIDHKNVRLEIDLKAALSVAKLSARIGREIEAMPSATFKILLQKMAPSQIHQKIASSAGIALKKMITTLSPADIAAIITALKQVQFSIVDYRPFAEAIITAGGVSTDECDDKTMESKIISGLYFAGEVLDIDADTGGYNIQLALSTGRLAGHYSATHRTENP